MSDFEMLTPEDYADIEREVQERGSLPALEMVVKKLQCYAVREVLPQWGIGAPALGPGTNEERGPRPGEDQA